jgi:hypothetical protein
MWEENASPGWKAGCPISQPVRNSHSALTNYYW